MPQIPFTMTYHGLGRKKGWKRERREGKRRERQHRQRNAEEVQLAGSRRGGGGSSSSGTRGRRRRRQSRRLRRSRRRGSGLHGRRRGNRRRARRLGSAANGRIVLGGDEFAGDGRVARAEVGDVPGEGGASATAVFITVVAPLLQTIAVGCP